MILLPEHPLGLSLRRLFSFWKTQSSPRAPPNLCCRHFVRIWKQQRGNQRLQTGPAQFPRLSLGTVSHFIVPKSQRERDRTDGRAGLWGAHRQVLPAKPPTVQVRGASQVFTEGGASPRIQLWSEDSRRLQSHPCGPLSPRGLGAQGAGGPQGGRGHSPVCKRQDRRTPGGSKEGRVHGGMDIVTQWSATIFPAQNAKKQQGLASQWREAVSVLGLHHSPRLT